MVAGKWIVSVLVALGLASCAAPVSPIATLPDQLLMEPNRLTVIPWSPAASQITEIHGTVLRGATPVHGAQVVELLSPGSNKAPITGTMRWETDPQGHFTVSVDRSQVVRLTFVLAGQNEQLARAVVDISYLPIVEGIAYQGHTMILRGRLEDAQGGPPPEFRIVNYRVTGTIRDARDHPVSGAVVSVTSDGGQQWSRSSPTDALGRYSLDFTADEPAELRVAVNNLQYSLPPGRVLDFPKSTSSVVDVRLPATGTTIRDQSGDVRAHTVSGAVYSGLAFGVMGSDGQPYYATAPDASGHWTLTMPSDAGNHAQLTYFEQDMTAFSQVPVVPGRPLPGAWTRSGPGPGDPQGMLELPMGK